MRKYSSILMLAAAVALAGCWESEGSLYEGQTPLEPLRAGKVEGVNLKDKAKDRSLLTKQAGGVYRLTNDVKDSSDYGDSFSLRFFALDGAPAKILVFEAQEHKNCKPSDNLCKPSDAHRNYGLARIEPNGASVVNPDCPKGGAVTKLPGVKADAYGVCDFTTRASLEKALATLAKKPWKPQVTYRYAD